jgi:hypothetical protein
VLRSVPVDPAPGRTDDERVRQHQAGRRSGVAESIRPTTPKPIDEE